MELREVRCPSCATRLFDQALALGSVIEVKCKCNDTYLVIGTTLGYVVAKAEHVTYNRSRPKPSIRS